MPYKLWWLIPLAAMAAIASYQDIRYRKIPNGVVVVVALLGVFFICQTEKFEQLYNPFMVLSRRCSFILFQCYGRWRQQIVGCI